MNNINRLSYTTSSSRPIREIRNVIKLYSACNKPCSQLYPLINFTTIMACHINTLIKLRVVMTNLSYLHFLNNKIVIVSSIDAPFHKTMVEQVKRNYPDIDIHGIPNNPHLDSGKWVYYLSNHYDNNSNFVVFTNDSYLIGGHIQHFYNAMTMRNVHLYAYNDSTQITYHYQSYLFGISNGPAIKRFLNHYRSVKSKLTGYMEVVLNIELQLVNLYPRSRDCFLKIGNIPSNVGQNIFFTNDQLYTILKNYKLLPFIKVKRFGQPLPAVQPKQIQNMNMSVYIEKPLTNNNDFNINISKMANSFTIVKNTARYFPQKQLLTY